MRSAYLFFLLTGDPGADERRQTALHDSPTGRSRLLVHHLTYDLARESVIIDERCSREYRCLTEPAAAQQFFQHIHAFQLVQPGDLAQTLKTQPCFQR